MESDLLASLGPANYLRTRADILVSPSSGVRCYNCVACVCWALQESFPFPALTFRTSSFLWLCSSPHPSRPPSCSPLPVLSPLPSRKHYLFGQSGQISLDCGENKTKHNTSLHSWQTKSSQCPLLKNGPSLGWKEGQPKICGSVLGFRKGHGKLCSWS